MTADGLKVVQLALAASLKANGVTVDPTTIKITGIYYHVLYTAAQAASLGSSRRLLQVSCCLCLDCAAQGATWSGACAVCLAAPPLGACCRAVLLSASDAYEGTLRATCAGHGWPGDLPLRSHLLSGGPHGCGPACKL